MSLFCLFSRTLAGYRILALGDTTPFSSTFQISIENSAIILILLLSKYSLSFFFPWLLLRLFIYFSSLFFFPTSFTLVYIGMVLSFILFILKVAWSVTLYFLSVWKTAQPFIFHALVFFFTMTLNYSNVTFSLYFLWSLSLLSQIHSFLLWGFILVIFSGQSLLIFFLALSNLLSPCLTF